MPIRCPLLFVPFLVCACAPSSSKGPTPFQFQSTSSTNFNLRVELDGLPLGHCFVQVQAAADTNAPVAIVFNGATNIAGKLHGDLNLPAGASEVTLIIQHPGASGANTDEVSASEQCPFAPSARIVFPLDEIGQMLVTLTKDEA